MAKKKMAEETGEQMAMAILIPAPFKKKNWVDDFSKGFNRVIDNYKKTGEMRIPNEKS